MVRVVALVFGLIGHSLAQNPDLTNATLAIQDAIEHGDLAGASRLLDPAIREFPRDGGLLNLRGIVHAQRNETSEARRDFAQAVRLSPDLKPAWQNLARACQMEATQDATAATCAMDGWKRVLHWNPGDQEAHNGLALLYQVQGRFADSLHELAELPSAAANLMLRCLDLCGLGRIPEAKVTAYRLARDATFSETDLDPIPGPLQSSRSAPVLAVLIEGLDSRQAASPKTLRRLAVAYEQSQRIAEARKTLERVATLEPNNTVDLLELARLADLARDYEGALGYLAHARDLEPNNSRIHYLFARIATEMDLPVEARRSLDRALALEPDNPDYNYAMGTVILASRDAAASLGYFQKFVRARPESAAGHYALGIAYFTSGDYAKAKAELRSVEDGPKGAGAKYFLGRIARAEGDSDAAAHYLQQSIALLPAFAPSHTELGRVWMEAGKLDQAHSELDRAVQLDPRNFQANSQLLAYYKRTRDSRAEKQQELLKQLDEDRSKRAELMLRTVEVRP